MKSSAQLQLEADHARMGLSHSLDGLRTGVTPHVITNEMLTLAKDSSVSIARSLLESAKANPVPALLIGLGLSMLLTRATTGSTTGLDVFDKAGSALKGAVASTASAVMHATSAAASGVKSAATGTASGVSSAASSVRHAATDAVSGARHAAIDAVSGVRHTAEGLAHGARSAAEQAADRASGVLSNVQTRMSSTASDVANAASRSVDQANAALHDGEDQVRHAADRATYQAQHLATQTRDVLAQFMEQQPILVAAIGAGIGAALASAFPVTETEKRYIGAAGAKATQAGRDTLAKVADVVKTETIGDNIGGKVEEKVGALADKVVQAVGGDKGDATKVAYRPGM